MKADRSKRRTMAGACLATTLLGVPAGLNAAEWMQMNMSGHNCQASNGRFSYDEWGASNLGSSDITATCPLVTSSGVTSGPLHDAAPSHAVLDMVVIYSAPTGGFIECQGAVRDYLKQDNTTAVTGNNNWFTAKVKGYFTVALPSPPPPPHPSGPSVTAGYMALPFEDGTGYAIGGGHAQKAFVSCKIPKNPGAPSYPGRILAYSVSYSMDH
jgi:hypothetical protein